MPILTPSPLLCYRFLHESTPPDLLAHEEAYNPGLLPEQFAPGAEGNVHAQARNG